MGASEGDWVLLARKGLGYYCQWVLGTQREDKSVVLEEVRLVKKKDVKVPVTSQLQPAPPEGDILYS